MGDIFFLKNKIVYNYMYSSLSGVSTGHGQIFTGNGPNGLGAAAWAVGSSMGIGAMMRIRRVNKYMDYMNGQPYVMPLCSPRLRRP